MALITYSRLKQPNEVDDGLYLDWLKRNPNGFVFTFTLPDEKYVTLHSARCAHVTRERAPGAYTRGYYGKHCAANWSDARVFINRPDVHMEECSSCTKLHDAARHLWDR